MSVRRAQYLDLADQLADRWKGLAPGSPVESEHQLATEFSVNRLTAREAMRELERRLVVRRVAGSGTFTAHRLDYRVELGDPPSFRRTVSALGHVPGVRVIDARWMSSAATRRFVVTRELTVDGLVASVAEDTFTEPIADRVAPFVAEGGSIVDALRTVGRSPNRAGVRVSMELTDDALARQLGFSGTAPPIWRLSSTTTDGRSGPVIHRSTSWMRPDMFALSIEIGSTAGSMN